jgi:hypothetical protein
MAGAIESQSVEETTGSLWDREILAEVRLEIWGLGLPERNWCQAWGYRNHGLSPLAEPGESSKRPPQKWG